MQRNHIASWNVDNRYHAFSSRASCSYLAQANPSILLLHIRLFASIFEAAVLTDDCRIREYCFMKAVVMVCASLGLPFVDPFSVSIYCIVLTYQ